MMAYFVIPGELPTLNEYINKERANRYAAAKLKRDAQEQIGLCIKATKVPRFTGHVYVYFNWTRSNQRCDKDNVAFAKKFILDALQEEGIIERDSWKLCTPIDNDFFIDKTNPRTLVVISTEKL